MANSIEKTGFMGLDHSGPRRTDNDLRELLGLPPFTPEQQERREKQRIAVRAAEYEKSEMCRAERVREAEKVEERATAPKRTYREPSVENIPVGGWYFGSTFGCQGVAKSLPESQGASYGYTGRFSGKYGGSGSYVSARGPRQECKIMVTYFIRCGATDFVKIGQSNRVQSRLESLQTANPHPLELMLCLPWVMGFREEDMHTRFASHRQHGEWFSYTADLKGFIEEKMRLRNNPTDLSLKPTIEDLKLAKCSCSYIEAS